MISKTVLVIGGTSGIGEASAKVFSSKGWAVILSGRDKLRGEAILNQLTPHTLGHCFIKADVTSENEIRTMFEKIRAQYEQLNAAFNSAGILGEPDNISSMSEQEFRRVIDVNLIGTFNALKYEMEIMSKQRSGSIINCSSIGGVVGMPGISAYVASKHAIIGLTKSAALEVAPAGVRVNCVSPGATFTPMQYSMLAKDPNLKASLEGSHPLGRIANAEEVANAVFWLASDESSFVTGSNLMVDGGFSAK